MMDDQADPLWPHFAPLWSDLRAIAPGLLLAGGYGLFLKQKWLLSQSAQLNTERGAHVTIEPGASLVLETGVPTLIAVQQWTDQPPRVTKDLDFVVDVTLIASPAEQKRLHSTLAKHEFHVVEKNARWQFEKILSEAQNVVVEFHAPPPRQQRDDLRVDSRRVKPNPSLGPIGIQGRKNAEAIGCELHPSSFIHQGTEINVPNPVTLTFMKLAAMRDRRLASQDETKSPEERDFEQSQSQKHAQDVFRIMAMMTRGESELTAEVLEATRETDVFTDAVAIYREYFHSDDAWGTHAVAHMWSNENLQLIKGMLAKWFSSPQSASLQ